MLIDEVELHLKEQPDQSSKRRKLLRKTPLATWELRVGELRVFYDINAEENAVEIVAVGVKEHNRLSIGGEEIEL